MQLSISEILKNANNISSKQGKINYLRENWSQALLVVLRYTFDPNLKFLLPEGRPQFKKSDYRDSQGMLYGEVRKLYLFVEGGNDNLNQMKREQLFVGILESIDPEDAELLLHVKEKKLPYKGITLALVQEAFPEQING